MSNRRVASQQPGQEKKRTIFRLRYFLTIILILVVVPVAAAGWTDIYRNIIERNKPVIDVMEVPRGIGAAPVTLKFRVSDDDAGLDEAVIRLRQKNNIKELQRIKFEGKKSQEIEIQIDGEKLLLYEGGASVEVRAFDKSFWNNASELSYPLRVDYKKPKVEVVSEQHNARAGGSQMLFYKAFDEDMAVSGVKVGGTPFLGFPASGIDREFTDPSLYVVIYAVNFDQDPKNLTLRAFAEDKVGNANSTSFYNKIAPRNDRSTKIVLNEEFMREKISPLADNFRTRIAKSGNNQELINSRVEDTDDRLVKDFQLVNSKLRFVNDSELVSFLNRSPRHEAYFKGPFQRQLGAIQSGFGDLQTYYYQDAEIGTARNKGEEILLPREQKDIYAANDGIVIFAENIGVYGMSIGIDHGLGLVTIYSRLGNISAKKGEVVQRGQVIGSAGRSGFSRNNHLYFEMRMQGVPVEPREWCDSGWFYSQIAGKINEVKKILGMAVYVPLR